MRALPSLITCQVSEYSIVLSGRSRPISNGGGDSTSTKYKKRIVPCAASCSTMKKFSAYISVLTIAWMPRSMSGMSRSEPARSEMANSARCRFSERSSCSCESRNSAHSSTRRRCWPASCSGACNSSKKPASACPDCSCSNSNARSGCSHRRMATWCRSGCQCGPLVRAACSSHAASICSAGSGGTLCQPADSSRLHNTLAATQPGRARTSASIAAATSSGACATVNRASQLNCNDPSYGVDSTTPARFIAEFPPTSVFHADRPAYCGKTTRRRRKHGHRQPAPMRPNTQYR